MALKLQMDEISTQSYLKEEILRLRLDATFDSGVSGGTLMNLIKWSAALHLYCWNFNLISIQMQRTFLSIKLPLNHPCFDWRVSMIAPNFWLEIPPRNYGWALATTTATECSNFFHGLSSRMWFHFACRIPNRKCSMVLGRGREVWIRS